MNPDAHLLLLLNDLNGSLHDCICTVLLGFVLWRRHGVVVRSSDSNTTAKEPSHCVGGSCQDARRYRDYKFYIPVILLKWEMHRIEYENFNCVPHGSSPERVVRALNSSSSHHIEQKIALLTIMIVDSLSVRNVLPYEKRGKDSRRERKGVTWWKRSVRRACWERAMTSVAPCACRSCFAI